MNQCIHSQKENRHRLRENNRSESGLPKHTYTHHIIEKGNSGKKNIKMKKFEEFFQLYAFLLINAYTFAGSQINKPV